MQEYGGAPMSEDGKRGSRSERRASRETRDDIDDSPEAALPNEDANREADSTVNRLKYGIGLIADEIDPGVSPESDAFCDDAANSSRADGSGTATQARNGHEHMLNHLQEIRPPATAKHLTWRDIKDLEPWKRAMFWRWFIIILVFCLAYLGFVCTQLVKAGENEQSDWYTSHQVSEEYNTLANERAEENNSVKVTTGTYVETVNAVNIKESSYTLTMKLWFRWDGNDDLDMANNFTVYRGKINTKETLVDLTEGETRYQLLRVNVTVNQVYSTERFPLESHQLNTIVESEYPAVKVILVTDPQDPTQFNTKLPIAGYRVTGGVWGVSSYIEKSTHDDPSLVEAPVTSEYVTAINIERDGFGLFFKCFIAMYGTTIWVLIMLYICGHHRVDPLGMIPGALFGTVSNIMVGAALLPDALSLGLLEYTNIWGVLTIVICAVVIIQINNIRSEHGRKDENYARLFGRAMFWLVTPIVVIGNFLLPIVAYLA